MNFSEKLKEIRKNEGLSQEQLAEKIGVSRQAITKWETGKGLPDVDNMVIMAEIFKVTLDELLLDSAAGQERETQGYTSETVYDIDCEKHFDVKIGSAQRILLSAGKDEKLHVKLSSATIADLDTLIKIKLDEKKNRLDVDCMGSSRLSRYEAEEALVVELVFPAKYAEHCEIAASAKRLEIRGIHLRRLEYDGDAERILISDSSGSLEFNAKTDYDITVDKITGRLEVNQWKAKTVLHIPKEHMVKVTDKGRKCRVYYRKGEKITTDEAGISGDTADGGNELCIAGVCSELTIDLL